MANTVTICILMVVDAAIWLNNLLIILTGRGFV